MNHYSVWKRSRSLVGGQWQNAPADVLRPSDGATRPTIILSRTTGSGARSVAEKLAAYLQQRNPQGMPTWILFDRNLVHRVLEDHQLPQRLARFVPDEKVAGVDYAVEELLGLHPSWWTMIQHTVETILALTRLGNVILVGRGAAAITHQFKNAFHVRLVASLDKRIAQVQSYYGMGQKEARQFIQREDRQRRQFLKKYFDRDIEDPLLYHLTLNTGTVSYDEIARTIGDAVLRRHASALESSTEPVAAAL